VKIERFEDIKAWQEARVLVKSIYDAAKSDRDFAVDYRLRDQIHSAAVSIMSNIAEGFSRRTTKEFVQFLFVAKGSAAEVESQLYVALDQGYIDREKFDDFYSKSDEVARLTSGFIRYLLNKNKPQALKEPNKTKQLDKLNKPEMLKELK
jgi:four helix bundle protein